MVRCSYGNEVAPERVTNRAEPTQEKNTSPAVSAVMKLRASPRLKASTPNSEDGRTDILPLAP